MTAGKKIVAGLEDTVAVAYTEGKGGGRIATAGDIERVKIKQSRGPQLEFEGRLLCSTEWDARDSRMRLELWQTKGGSLIPVTIGSPGYEGAREIVTAAVVEAGDEAEMRFAAMSQWDWTDRARSMVRKRLGWKLTLVVE